MKSNNNADVKISETIFAFAFWLTVFAYVVFLIGSEYSWNDQLRVFSLPFQLSLDMNLDGKTTIRDLILWLVWWATLPVDMIYIVLSKTFVGEFFELGNLYVKTTIVSFLSLLYIAASATSFTAYEKVSFNLLVGTVAVLSPGVIVFLLYQNLKII